ncbi:hypothetical protein [Hymenobacter metallilatus]|uniref:Uncharacterized protein n=1 Tax=Hymenobacter metallilatus TaxID=2493666 RepID=A0A428IYJ8_9BACT|nr:hypothetical protein [Hymenobacter metallilatus]RSK24182.1 hypothetical protein EI290_20595 [Hymenobacter metallilatus]
MEPVSLALGAAVGYLAPSLLGGKSKPSKAAVKAAKKHDKKLDKKAVEKYKKKHGLQGLGATYVVTGRAVKMNKSSKASTVRAAAGLTNRAKKGKKALSGLEGVKAKAPRKTAAPKPATALRGAGARFKTVREINQFLRTSKTFNVYHATPEGNKRVMEARTKEGSLQVRHAGSATWTRATFSKLHSA